jgi:hypothetical protein
MGTGSSIAGGCDRLSAAIEEKRRLVQETERLLGEAQEQAESAACHFRELRNGTPEWRLIWPRTGPVVVTPDAFPGRREAIRLPSPVPPYHGWIPKP